MNAQELLQRQQQIRKLHRRIREYRLTPQEQQILQRNKYELECMIETKFSQSKSNCTYRFPGAEQSQRLGVREQIDLHAHQEDVKCKLNTMSCEGAFAGFLDFSTQKTRQSHSPQFRPYNDSLSHQKRLTELKQPKRYQQTNRLMTEADVKNRSQLEIEEEPSALKIPVSKCTAKRRIVKEEDQHSRRLLKRTPEMRLSAKESELRIKVKGKENEKKQVQQTEGTIKTSMSAKANLSAQLKKIVLGRTPDDKKSSQKHKAGILLVQKTLHKTIQPSTCKAKTKPERFQQELHYLRPQQKSQQRDRLSKRSKGHSQTHHQHHPTSSKSPNKPDHYARMFQSIKVKNNQSTASSTNQSSLTPMHASFKQSIFNSKSTCRMNLVSPLNKGYLVERKWQDDGGSLRVVRK